MKLFTINKITYSADGFKDMKDMFLLKMAFWLMFISLAIIVCMIYVPIPPSGADTAKYTVGFLFGTLLGTLIANIYGTSQGSKEKGDQLYKMQDKGHEVKPGPFGK